MSGHSCVLYLGILISAIACSAEEPKKKDSGNPLSDWISANKDDLQGRRQRYVSEKLDQPEEKDSKGFGPSYYAREFDGKLTRELVTLIKSNGQYPAAFEGILVLVRELNGNLDNDLVQLVLKHHLSDARMGQLCFDLRNRWAQDWVSRFLEEVIARHPAREVRGQAHYALGVYHRSQTQPDRWANLSEEEQANRFSEAAKHFVEVSKNYATIMTPDGKAKLGDKASSELQRIKNLPNLKIGRTAPEIIGEGSEGKRFKLSDYRGKVVLLVFWRNGYNLTSFNYPYEPSIVKRFAEKRFALISVNSKENREEVKQAIAKNQLNSRSLWDGDSFDGLIRTAYNVFQRQRTYVIDPDGVIRYIDVRGYKLDDAIDKLITEMEKKGKDK